MRLTLLQAVAGSASVTASIWGFVAWWSVPSSAHPAVPFGFQCLLTALSFPAFVLYLRRPRTGVIVSWLLLSGSWFAGFLLRLHVCIREPCTTIDMLRIAGQTIIREPYLWLQIAVAVCLTLDYSDLAVEKLRSRRETSVHPPPES